MYFRFCEFLDDVRFLEKRNNIFEENSLKAFLRQSFRVFDFSNLSRDSRYLESWTLNHAFLNLKLVVLTYSENYFSALYLIFLSHPKQFKYYLSLSHSFYAPAPITPSAATCLQLDFSIISTYNG